MPTYEYECMKCGHVFERFQNMTDPPARRCPLCRCKVRRLFGTGAGLLFKGSGFYQTDYRSPEYRKAAEGERKGADTKDKADTAKSSDGASSGVAKSDKPAAKS